MERWVRALDAILRLPRPLLWGLGVVALAVGGFIALWLVGTALAVLALGAVAGAIYGLVHRLTAKRTRPQVIELQDYRRIEDERE